MDKPWDTLFGVLPDELPAAIRYFVVFLIVFHLLAILVWMLSTARETLGSKKPKTF